jgi:adenine-specific DNA-methyltransferase
MAVKSIKHIKEKRVLIPSREEAGAEAASPKVKGGKEKAEFPVNPIVHRGQDPELFWMNKYGSDDSEDKLTVDIRSLYRHEHIAPEKIIQKLYRLKEIPNQQLELNGLFGNGLKLDEIDKVSEYYKHADNWTNRMIQGDSLLVMTSLLEREGMAGRVQMIYIDPPYGIKYGTNWQMKLNNRNVNEGDDGLSGEPEQIKAYRDTWELGIHSYLSYLRERLLVTKELLTESGSCFVQISDENVHLVRCLMDEVFGSENFISLIYFSTTGGFASNALSRIGDFIIWYAKDKSIIKYRQIFLPDRKSVG